jgi:sialic acid synthase SpsE
MLQTSPVRRTSSTRVAADLFASATASQPARVCVVAEIGVNHDGNVAIALDLVDLAAAAGADAVKLQLFDPRHLLSNAAGLAKYQADEGESDVFTMLQRLMLSAEDIGRVKARARAKGLAFIVTPFSLQDVRTLRMIEPDAVKIASPDAVNTPLLDAAVALGKPMIISTGTSELKELLHAAALVHRNGGCLLQCVSSYPTPDDAAAIGGMVALAECFDVPVGYSDHTNDLMTGAYAVAAGACVLEKHFTYDRNAAGPDHAASFEAPAFAQYVANARRAAAMMGVRCKTVGKVEQEVRMLSRQSVCLVRDLPAGHVLTAEDLTVKRPGTGIPAAELAAVVGQRLARPVRGNDLLTRDDLSQRAVA